MKLSQVLLFIGIFLALSCHPKNHNDPAPAPSKFQIMSSNISELQRESELFSQNLDDLDFNEVIGTPSFFRSFRVQAFAKLLSQTRFQQNALEGDIELQIQLILFQTANEAKDDLAEMMEDLKDNNDHKQGIRDNVKKMLDLVSQMKNQAQSEYKEATSDQGSSNELTSFSFWMLSQPSGPESVQLGSLDASKGKPSIEAVIDCSNSSSRVQTAELVPFFGPSSSPILASNGAVSKVDLQLQKSLNFANLKIKLKSNETDLIQRGCQVTVSKPIDPNSRRVISSQVLDRNLDLLNSLDQKFFDFQKVAQSPGSKISKELATFVSRAAIRIRNHISASVEEDKGLMFDELKDKKDAVSELNEMDTMMIQSYMDKKGKLEEMISNLLKAISDTQGQIASNLK